MLYLTNEIWFTSEYNPDLIDFNNTITGFFLIVKNDAHENIYLCDFAVVRKRSVRYFPNFTRLFLAELKNSIPLFKIDNKSPKIIKLDKDSKNEFNYFTQVISDESYYKISQEYSKSYAKKVFIKLGDLGVSEQQGIKNIGFNKAKELLLSHSRSRYAYHKGIELLFSKDLRDYLKKTSIDRLKIKLTNNDERNICLLFNNKVLGRIPINIFIGKNGSGKSYTIEKLIKGYLRGEYEQLSDSINKIVVISNTINDKYPSTKKTFSKYKNETYDSLNIDYDYFSTIRKVKYNATEGVQSVDLRSLIEDLLIREVSNELPFSLLDILERTIKNNIGCSFVGLDNTMSSFRSLNELLDKAKDFSVENRGANLKLDYISLMKGGESANLSSGQENFIFTISCLLSAIHNNSLIFIDELENFLHPNFITHAMKILKDCLIKTNSVCIIATHSLHIAREIPREGVTIFERIGNDEQFTAYKPEVESYSCNLQLMSNYIFNTREEDSLFDGTLRAVAGRYKNKKQLINDLHGDVSHEIILSIADRIDENK